MVKTILLVRHGESETNLSKRFTGQLDAPLTALGRRQAEAMAEYLDRYTIDRIYVSSLQRAVDTAQTIVQRQNCPLVRCDAFREINAGSWQGKTFSEIAQLYPGSYQVWRENIALAWPEDGESCRQLYDRVIRLFTQLAETDGEETICIVAHATPIRMIESYIAAGSADLAQSLSWVPNASTTVYRYDGAYHKVLWGESAYLGDMATNLPKSI